MTDYSSRLTSSDLDAFRSDGIEYTDTLTLSGTLAGSSTVTATGAGIVMPNLDFYQVTYENIITHSGKWRDIALEPVTTLNETTFGSDISAFLTVTVANGVLTVRAIALNPYGSSVALQSTTINIRVVAYDSTLL